MKRLVFPGVIGVALYFVVAGGEYSFLDLRRAESELEVRRNELPAVRRQIDSLRARIDSLQHDDEALERLARERYGFIRDGELLYRLTETEAPPEPAVAPRRSVFDRMLESLGLRDGNLDPRDGNTNEGNTKEGEAGGTD